MVAGELAIIYILPRFTKAVPSPLVAIIAITVLAIFTQSDVRTIGDIGDLTQVKVTTLGSEGAHKKVYHVSGQLFFASVTDFVDSFDYTEKVKEINLDLTQAHLWDDSAVGVIDKIVIKYHQNGVKVNLIGLNTESNKLIDKIAIHNKPGGLDKVVNH